MINLKKWVLAVAIAIVLNLFINYGISVFYKAPQYDDFCTDQSRYAPYPAKPYPDVAPQNCTPVFPSQELKDSCAEQKGYINYKYNDNGCATEAYCELCGKMFDDVNQKRNSNVFVILVVFGVVAIVTGFVLRAEAVANGFLFGGILSLVIAAARNWGQLQDIFKFIILGAVLALLIWIGYKKGGISGSGFGKSKSSELKQQQPQQPRQRQKKKKKKPK